MENSAVRIVEVSNKHLLKEYVQLVYQLYSEYKHFVPPLLSDEFDFHNPSKNLAMNGNPVIRALAYRGEKIVGRIMGIIPERFNKALEVKHCRFFQFDCIQDAQVAQQLIDYVTQWGKKHNLQQLTGPFGFSDKDPQGLQIEGYEYLPVLAAPCNPPYLPQLLVNMGFEKETDCVSYSVPVPDQVPGSYELITQRILKAGKFKMVSCSNRLAMRKYIYPLLELVNESFREIYGFNRMGHREMKQLANKYFLFLDPRFLKIVTDQNNKPVAFILGIPDISAGLQKAKGKLLPFGFYHIIQSGKKSKQLDMLLGGVHPELQSKGMTALLAVQFLSAASRYGMKTMDSHLVLETNTMMNREMQRAGGHIYKRYRIFKKRIS
ncbi:MAG: hypothetical protein LC117_02540 [Bacteroidia bacterium]|nr:hypothetical protein [Bacteroidia bacterium]MCZ2276793.1 hypothetical protein [Bacteroidia bacterium]